MGNSTFQDEAAFPSKNVYFVLSKEETKRIALNNVLLAPKNFNISNFRAVQEISVIFRLRD